MSQYNQLKPAPGARRKAKRLGMGTGSHTGKTSGRGEKGQYARSNGKGPGFEGGQMPLIRRVPKRGFTNPFRQEYAVVNLSTLNGLEGVAEVTVEYLREHGLVRKSAERIKVLGSGELTRAVKVRVHAVSGSARSKIEAAGGSIELL